MSYILLSNLLLIENFYFLNLDFQQKQQKRKKHTSKNGDKLIVSEVYLEILNSSYEVKFLYDKCKTLETIKKMMSEIEIKMNNLFENFVITPMEIKFDDILALAIAYMNLGRIYMQVNLNVAKSYFARCMQLLKGKERDSP